MCVSRQMNTHQILLWFLSDARDKKTKITTTKAFSRKVKPTTWITQHHILPWTINTDRPYNFRSILMVRPKVFFGLSPPLTILLYSHEI